MAAKLLIVPLTGAAVLAGAMAPQAQAAGLSDRGACTFCAPRYVAVAPEFYASPDRSRPQDRAGYASSPYTRFDIEGIRLMTRMP